MEHTEGKWKIISRKDDSYDSPYYEYHIISYPYGIEAGPERICEPTSKANARRIVQCCNNFDGLLEACKLAESYLETKCSKKDCRICTKTRTDKRKVRQVIAAAEKQV